MKRTITVSASISVAAFMTASGAMAAPIQWSSSEGGNDHWYEVNDDLLTWQGAQTEAASRGGYLATVTSAGENAFLDDLASGFNLFLWLGGSDAAIEGDWFWMTGPEAGTQFWEGGKDGNAVGGAYTNWADGEPNNAVIGNEDYLAVWSSLDIILPDGEWNDLANGLYGSIIEYDTNPFAVPEPSTAALALAGLAGLALRRRKKAA